MPNVENLKKQAKRYARWHRDRYYPVAAVIRTWLPGREHLSDREIFEAAFTLSDGQRLVAKQHGFKDWSALLAGVKTMAKPISSRSDSTVILGGEPQLLVSDLDASLAFYCGQLGFQVAFSHGKPPFYAQILRDNARLNLRHVEGPVFAPELRANEHDILSATLTLVDAKPLFLEFQRAGVRFHQSLRTEPWGSRTFIVADPDGNLIAFAGQAT